MKPNVDLTENQMFTKTNSILLKDLLKGMGYPWNNGLHEIIRDKESIIATGTKLQRKHYKMCENTVSGDYCDRCGIYLKNKPWTKCFGLCFNCYAELDKELRNKKLWIN